MKAFRHINPMVALGLIMLILAPVSSLSKGLSDSDTMHVIPYDEGDFERIPSAAASIHLLDCEQTYKGALLRLKVDVFESAWRPVYAIEITGLNNNTIEAVDCPPGWTSEAYPGALNVPTGSLSLYTESRPILPGSSLSGFTLLSGTNRAVLRWYTTDKSGIMLGKVTRSVLTCAASTVPKTWGSVKTIYR